MFKIICVLSIFYNITTYIISISVSDHNNGSVSFKIKEKSSKYITFHYSLDILFCPFQHYKIIHKLLLTIIIILKFVLKRNICEMSRIYASV